MFGCGTMKSSSIHQTFREYKTFTQQIKLLSPYMIDLLKCVLFLTMHRYIDHGDGVLTLRIQDPFVFDSGNYLCLVTSTAGDCRTECNVEINETYGNIDDLIPEFIKVPSATIALPGSTASFCTRVSPIDSDVTWSVCGREITSDLKGFSVRIIVTLIYK